MTDANTVVTHIELRHIYDGWSVAVMKDGRMVNRWPKDDHRHALTQEWIDRQPPGFAAATVAHLSPPPGREG